MLEARLIVLYGVARNSGMLPGWGREIMAIGWPTAILALAAAYTALRRYCRRLPHSESLS